MTKYFFLFLILSIIGNSYIFGQYNILILDHNTNVSLEKDKLIEENFFLIQINDAASNWISEVSISFNENEELDILEAQIMDLHGNVLRKIKNKEITTLNDRSIGTFYSDYFVKEFDLKWNQYPYLIKYRYKRTSENYISLVKWTPNYWLKIPVKKASLTVTLPSDLKHYMDYSDDNLSFTSIEAENITTLQWKAENIKIEKEEEMCPELIELAPHVFIIPHRFFYGLEGYADSWASFGVWLSGLALGADQITDSEKQVVDQLLKGIKDPYKKIEILYHYLQDNTRYINISLGIGGLKPYPASYVCEKKYGDCKALTNYMQALLKYAGIESFYTIIYAGDKPVRINPDLVSNQFNHVILCVPLDGDTIWLENTSSYMPFNHLGTFTQGRYALLVNDSLSSLVKTPSLNINDVEEFSEFEVNINLQGMGNMTANMNLRSDPYETLLTLHKAGVTKEKEKYIKKIIPFKNFELESWDIELRHRDSLNIYLKADLKIKNQILSLGKYFSVVGPNSIVPKLEKPENRNYPVRISYPTFKNYHIRYNIENPDKLDFILPEKIEIDSPYGFFSQESYMNNEQVVQEFSFKLHTGEYTIKDYNLFFNFIKSVEVAQKKSIILIKKN
jgi:hypothetical protein